MTDKDMIRRGDAVDIALEADLGWHDGISGDWHPFSAKDVCNHIATAIRTLPAHVQPAPVAEVQAEAVAGAYAAAIGIAVEYRAVAEMDDEHDNGWRSCATFIENRLTEITPADARAALDRIRAEARDKALREALGVAKRYSHLPDGGKIAQMIEALIKEPAHD